MINSWSNVSFFMIVATFGVLVRLGTFVVYEGSQVTITQFGRILEKPYQEPGVYFRIPLVQKTHYMEKRIETWEGYVDYIPTADRQYMAIESIAHWRVEDPIVFMEALGSKELAESRLDSILNGALKDMISSHKLVDTVRNSNRILNDRRAELDVDIEGTAHLRAVEQQLNDAIASTLESVSVGREHLTRKMVSQAAAELKPLGIELLNMYIKRISYAPSVELRVYERMTSERTRVAERLVSLGRGERERILGQLSKDAQDILAPAHREAEIIRGRADARALATYRHAFGSDPEFYNFWRSLQAYRVSLPDNTEIVSSTENKYYNVLFDRHQAGIGLVDATDLAAPGSPAGAQEEQGLVSSVARDAPFTQGPEVP